MARGEGALDKLPLSLSPPLLVFQISFHFWIQSIINEKKFIHSHHNAFQHARKWGRKGALK